MSTSTAVNPYASLNGSTSSATSSATSSTGSASTTDDASDRFLKLLVTQLQNQDPLNPMDNAEVTSQMAQINTVSGIDKLNTTVSALSTQFVQLQVLAGASLVGSEVTLKGNRITASDDGAGGLFELAGTADAVKVEVLSPAGRVVDTLQLGAQTAGQHAFDWDASGVSDPGSYSFRITATSGSTAVTSTALMRDKVLSVAAGGSGLVLSTEKSGDVAYADVKAFN